MARSGEDLLELLETLCYDLNGSLIATTRHTWNTVGIFDEKYKLYFEESDWLFRLRRAGLEAHYVPSAHARHLYNQSGVMEPRAQQWYAESEKTFELTFFGTAFCLLKRVLAKYFPGSDEEEVSEVIPLREGLPEIPLPRQGHQGHLELSPLRRGFPAGVIRFDTNTSSTWRFPASIWQYVVPGTYYLRWIDSEGNETMLGHFEKEKEDVLRRVAL